MEAQGKERSILRDLALIYIALAHSTDQDLSEAEVETISRRLRAWQTQVAQETVLSAIKDALEDYTQESAHPEVERAVRRVRDELDHEQREMIVDDLTEIAMADDKFLHEEGSFIGDLARAWDVHTNQPVGADTPWTVLIGRSKNGWSPLHDLALVYLHLAHRTDDDLDTDEIDTIAEKLNEWAPGVGEDQVLNVVQGAMHAYVQGPDKRVFEDSVESLKKSVPEHQRPALLSDLQQIAQSDGEISAEEEKVIDRLTKAWSVGASA